MLKYTSKKLENRLRKLHKSHEDTLLYPNYKQIQTAIYDIDKHYIFGTYPKAHTFDATQKGILYEKRKVEPYYLGAAYILVAKPINEAPIVNLKKNILFFMLIAGLVFSVLGYYLGRLFVAPMRESLNRMNQFIQDTTHELNTPISTILTNIEMIEALNTEHQNAKELKRIEIASKTLSRIYDDLSYLNLNHHYHRKIETIDFSALTEERIAYFSSMAKAKDIKIVRHIVEGVQVEMDKNDALRLIDNLCSNAIKYNKHHGTLEVILNHETLVISDTGIGIKKEDLKHILQRFNRANKSEGGFGIGLHIVSAVCENYGFELEMYSEINEGTEVRVRWEK